MLIVDGVRYKPWTPTDEEKEFHPLVKAQSKEIFGKDTIYFDVKTTLKSASGIGSIPDAYVIDLKEPNEWYVVENELATHPVYDHVVKQLSKFINGIDNQDSRTQILELLYNQINKDKTLRNEVLTKTKSNELHHYLSQLILSKTPKIVVIIDEKTSEIQEACRALRYTPHILEFKTFKEDNSGSYAHLFDPLHSINTISKEKRYENQNLESIIERTNAQPEIEAIFRRFNREIERLSQDISRKTLKTRVLYKTKIPFVGVELRKKHVLLHLTLAEKSKYKEVNYLRKVHGNKWHGHLTVTNESEAESALEICKKAFEDSLR